MEFKKGQKVLIKSSNQYKTIVDCECIYDTQIYYMEDNSSYAESQISYVPTFDYEQNLEMLTKTIEMVDNIKESFKPIANEFIKSIDKKIYISESQLEKIKKIYK